MTKSATTQNITWHLNASLKLQEPGDAGKGFAVVAEEVQKLAKGMGEAAVQLRKHSTQPLRQLLHLIELTNSNN